MSESHSALQATLESRDEQRLATWTDSLGSIAAKLGTEWAQTSAQAANRQQTICDALAHTARDLSAQATAFEQHTAALLRTMSESHSALQATLESRDEQRLATWTDSLGSIAAKLGTEWAQTSAQAANRQQTICDALAHTSRDLSAQATAFEQHTAALLRAMSESHSALQATLESRDEQRLATWTDSLGSIAAKLGTEWEQTSAQAANRQQAIYDALAHTARDLSAHTQAHASATIAEISQLVQAASEAPRVAAEVVAELRQKLSDSMVRDTAMLEERNRMLATLETLLDAVNHASSEQRAAVDALVATSSALLQRVGTQFTDEVGTQTDRLGGVAAQITGSAVEIASLGDALGAAVQSFGESNDKLVAHLQRIEAALDKSLARSDEQLAYYVAQAREVIDLSMMSQKQIIEELQRVGGERASAGAAAA
ncbi:Methyl-accepting chemotaxis protein [Burkholderia pseudomallei]|nr:Methyl-accepting chemotaxis protein [Burkholderia pseudomallei]